MSAPTMVGEPRLLIDGRLVDAASGRTYDNVDPSTEEVLGVAADAGPDDADRAVVAARRAFDDSDWSRDLALRRRCLQQLHDAMQDADALLRDVLVAEGGHPSCLAYTPTHFLRYWTELLDTYAFESPIPGRSYLRGAERRLLRREPVGVVAAITPWNFPLYLNVAKVAPALAAGNTVVLKPSPETPWCASLLGRLAAERTDLPPGVLNVVTSSDPALGAVLTGHPAVDLVTFTGSTQTGRQVMAGAARTLKRLVLELGGKSPHIVLDDADLASVVPAAAAGVCAHSGQGCAWLTRLLLPRSRYDEGVGLAAEAMRQVRYGDPRDPANIQGPQITARQRERVLGYVDAAVASGARLVVGGGRPAHLSRGYYVEPTLLADCDPYSAVAQDEVFGPVLVAIPYDDDEQAVRIANDTMYGLNAAVSGGDTERALAVARRLRSGTVSVNGAPCFGPDIPMGGYKQSGIGRENGVIGFEEYLETKLVAVP